jgi:hypothetical protein
MSADFDENEDVPVSLPQVVEYQYPEGDYTEKAQDVEYLLDAAIASVQLQLAQLLRKKREIDRTIADLQARLDKMT